MNAKVSVVICVYNGDEFILDALNSIAHQTYQNIEIIIVNDGSTDASSSVVNQFIVNNPSLKVIYKEHSNMGLTKSLNIAIGLSTGEYIARMDADDISHSSRISESLKFIESNDLDFISTKATRFKGDTNLGSVPSINKNLFNVNEKLLHFGNPFVHGTFFFKKNIFNTLKYDEDYLTAQDYAYLASLAKAGTIKMGFLNKNLYYLRINENSLGRNINSTQSLNAKSIAIKYFNTDKKLIIASSGIKRVLLALQKRFYI